jgi:hypothetical protein
LANRIKAVGDNANRDKEEIGRFLQNMDSEIQKKAANDKAETKAFQEGMAAELEKHENGITELTSAIDATNKTIIALIQKEEAVRIQQDLSLKNDINSLADYKLQNDTFTERVAEMIKLEFDSRQANESLSQEAIEKLIAKVNTDLPALKSSVDSEIELCRKECLTMNQEIASKLNGVSQYVDEQNKAFQAKTVDELNKFKGSAAKITLQLKESLQKIEENRKKVEDKVFQYCKTLAVKQNEIAKANISFRCDMVAVETIDKMLDAICKPKSTDDVDGLRKVTNAMKSEIEALSKNVVSNIEALNDGMRKHKEECNKMMEGAKNKTQ